MNVNDYYVELLIQHLLSCGFRFFYNNLYLKYDDTLIRKNSLDSQLRVVAFIFKDQFYIRIEFDEWPDLQSYSQISSNVIPEFKSEFKNMISIHSNRIKVSRLGNRIVDNSVIQTLSEILL